MLDACFVLHAEHQMNASTFSARVTGSTLADPYSVVAAAVGTLSGPLHGGANEEVLDMLDEIGEPSKATGWLEHAVATKKKIMGQKKSKNSSKVTSPKVRKQLSSPSNLKDLKKIDRQ